MEATKKYDETLDKVFVHVPLDDETVESLRDALGQVVMTAAFPDRLLRRPDALFDDLERAFTSRFEFVFHPKEGGSQLERAAVLRAVRDPRSAPPSNGPLYPIRSGSSGAARARLPLAR